MPLVRYEYEEDGCGIAIAFLMFVIFVASPWFVPTYFAFIWVFDLESLHDVFKIIIVGAAFFANLFGIIWIISIVPTIAVGIIGAIQFAGIVYFFGTSEVENVDYIWLIFFMIIGAVVGYFIFAAISDHID